MRQASHRRGAANARNPATGNPLVSGLSLALCVCQRSQGHDQQSRRQIKHPQVHNIYIREKFRGKALEKQVKYTPEFLQVAYLECSESSSWASKRELTAWPERSPLELERPLVASVCLPAALERCRKVLVMVDLRTSLSTRSRTSS